MEPLKHTMTIVFFLLIILTLNACSNNNGNGSEALLTVTYNGNGHNNGSVPIDSAKYIEGSLITVMGNTGNLQKDGYQFAGWSMGSDGIGIIYTQGQTLTIGSSNVTLYAKWSTIPILYVKGNLFDSEADSALAGYKILHIATSNTITTNVNGDYKFEISGGEATHIFEIKDESDNVKGNFTIAVNENSTLNIGHGVIIDGSGFTTTIPKILIQEPVVNMLSQPYSEIPEGTDALKAAIVEVVHRQVIEPLYKSAWRRSAASIFDKYKRTIDGPGGGHATHVIIGDTVASDQYYVPKDPGTSYPWSGSPAEGGTDPVGATSDTSISSEKLHIIKFDNYTENSITINGTIAFIFGYHDNDNPWEAAWIYKTDTDAWGSQPGYWGTNNPGQWAHILCIQELVDYFGYRTQPHILANREDILTELDDIASVKTYPDTLSPDFISVNTLNITGTYTDSITFSFDILNQETAVSKLGISAEEAANTYIWKDELEFYYTFASNSNVVCMTELTGPGIYERTYTDAMDAFTALPKGQHDVNQEYDIYGPDGGNLTVTIEKEETFFGYSVLHRHAFNNYAANNIVLNGGYSLIYKTDSTGEFIEEITIPGTVDISGYFNATAMHKFFIFYNSNNFQMTNSYFIDDYPEVWQRTAVVLPDA